MKRIGPVSLTLAAAALATTGVLGLSPEGSPPSAGGDDELAAWRTGEAGRRGERMDARRDVITNRVRAKEQITIQLFRGELTLEQAVDHFREFTRDDPESVASMRVLYGVTGDEVYYRNVLGCARGAA